VAPDGTEGRNCPTSPLAGHATWPLGATPSESDPTHRSKYEEGGAIPFDNIISRADANALIPEEVADEVIKAAEAQSAALSLFRRVNMGTKLSTLPVLSALAQAYWVNGDTGLKQTTEMTWEGPQEARGLRWRDVGDTTLLVHAPKTRSNRSVRLLGPVKADLAAWRLLCGRPPDRDFVIPGEDGGAWGANGYAKWRGRTWVKALQGAGLEYQSPYALRHSFASLLAHEGRSVVYIARQLGHSAEESLRTYQHVIDELEDQPRITAEEAIRAARSGAGCGDCAERAVTRPRGPGPSQRKAPR
jgi:integrase